MLKRVDHPNIIKIFEFYYTPDAYYIALEFCEEGELFDDITEKGPFSEEYSAFIMYQILSAIFYCHSLNIVHRDLKPENVLIERREDKILRVKICDLGSATVFSRNKYERKIVGSSYYIAPEVLRKNYNEKCDVWSCGVILYILLSGYPPFPGESDQEIIENVEAGYYEYRDDLWNKISKEAKNLIDKMLRYLPNDRISAGEALNHPWFIKFKIKERLNNIIIKPEDEKIVENFLENIKNFKNLNPLQQAACAYLIHNTPQLEQIENAYKLFNRIDLNGDGRITKNELLAGFKYFYYSKFTDDHEITEDEVNKIFINIDTNYNNEIEFEEFARAAIDKKIFISEDFLLFAFKYFDKDGSGLITIDELRDVFMQGQSNTKQETIENQLKDTFDKVDTNKDGKISYEEFKEMMRGLLQ